MAGIPIKTSAAEDILHFDHDTLRGKERNVHLISRTCKMLNVVIVGSKLCLYRSCCKHSYSRKIKALHRSKTEDLLYTHKMLPTIFTFQVI